MSLILGTEITGGCELSNLGAGDRTPLLWKSSQGSQLLSHHFSSPHLSFVNRTSGTICIYYYLNWI